MITVMGAGAFGTALAISLAGRGPVTLWARDAAQAEAMQAARENTRRLPGAPLPPDLEVTARMPRPGPGDICLLAVPTQRLRGLLEDHAEALSQAALVACCKGVERGTGLGPSGVIADVLPAAHPAILTGPSFAQDIARGLPTALTLAAADAARGGDLQAALTTPNLRVYRTTDVAGAELGGALKNVIAIGCGAVIGAGLGESARAALMTRGFAEMARMAAASGAAPDTLYGLSGFGDLTLTCTSDQSRNYRFGLSLGRGSDFDREVTVEGAETARAVAEKARTLDLDMPITDVIVAIIDGELRVAEAVDMLLARPLKEE